VREGKLALIPPRYGIDVVGGAEAVLREVAHGLAGRGWSVEVLTTCSRDHYRWRNDYPAGVTVLDGVTVRRFPVIEPRVSPEHQWRQRRIEADEPLSYPDQFAWINGGVRSPALFDHLLRRRGEYRAVILSPYLSWTTVACSEIVPEKTVLIPCLHDEPYARLELFRELLARPGTLWFNSEPEHALAHRLSTLPTRHEVMGSGVLVPSSYDPEGFRTRHRLSKPFILFAGRRERGKGWDWLLQAFQEALARHRLPFDLLTIGVNEITIPPALAGRVIDLGFVDDDERSNAFAASAAYVQPSVNESFSRTMMEAWLAGTPVIANARCEVAAWHCERSDGGLTFGDSFELAQCLLLVAEAPQAARQLALAGREYVLANYRWDLVLGRMEDALEALV
jgi:glycosyltransferase involved in cell wall biosynthesis